MAAAKRPWGVTLLAVLSFISVGTYLVLTVLAIAAPETLRSLLEGVSPQGSGPAVLLEMGRVLGIYFAVMAILAGLFGYGLWTLRNWAHLVTIVIAVFSLIGTIVGLAQVASDINISTLLVGFLRIGLSVLVLWYLWTLGVRAAFRKRTVTETQ